MAKVIALVLVTVLGVLGDVALKVAGSSSTSAQIVRYLVLGESLYVLTGLVWYYLLRQGRLATVACTITVLNALGATVLGVLWFQETLSRKELLGFLLALLSIYLLSSEVS